MARIVGSPEQPKKQQKLSPIREVIRANNILRLSYYDLLQNTPGNIRDNSKNPKCGRRYLGVVRKPNGLTTFVWKAGCSGREHMTTIEISPTKAPLTVPCRVQCSCEYYVYNLEVVMAEAGMSENRYALPMWPVVRNPEGSKHLCKHLLLVGGEFNTKSRNVVNNPKSQDTLPPSQLVKKMDQSVVKTRRQAEKARNKRR